MNGSRSTQPADRYRTRKCDSKSSRIVTCMHGGRNALATTALTLSESKLVGALAHSSTWMATFHFCLIPVKGFNMNLAGAKSYIDSINGTDTKI